VESIRRPFETARYHCHTSEQENHRMTEGFSSIIKGLEQRKAVIERALVALREIDEPETPPDWVTPTKLTTAPASNGTRKVSPLKGRKVSAATRRRMIAAQRKRYAKG
jgi:hypothetical protein